MCGIAGIIAPSDWTKQDLYEAAKNMADTLSHRGPDAQGVWVNPTFPVVLAHRRLAIQDLSPAGHQPMTSAFGRFHIVFNGEIYNFRVLTRELQQAGHIFRGHSDTEVLLAAMEEWGIEKTLERCCGMFALAVWDTKTQELILCRDRMGEKPLYYGWLDGCFVFASELKALHRVFRTSLTINNDAMTAFFRFGYVPTPHCIYKNVFKLLPGCLLRIPITSLPTVNEFNPMPCNTCFSPHPYWILEKIARQGLSNMVLDENDAIEQLDILLRDTISQQKIADVPIGAFLSGGIDSSLVAAVMQAVSDNPIRTFTIGFTEKEFDEAPYARAIAKHLRTEHFEFYVSANDGLSLIESIPKHWDEPFADSSQIPSLIVAKMARNEVTVCLTGDSGDELFCGYHRYFIYAAIWAKKEHYPKWLRKIIGQSIGMISDETWQSIYKLFQKFDRNHDAYANMGFKIHKFAEIIQKDSANEAYRFLMSYWHDPCKLLNHPYEALSILDRQKNPKLGHFINDAMYWDQAGYLVDDNLVKVDRASMAVSLETRLPLLNHHIVEFSWRLPIAMKYREGQSKWLLRQVLYRYVPRSLIERPKMGFSVPIQKWLKGPLKTWFEDLLFSNKAHMFDGLNQKMIQEVWRQHINGIHDHSNKLWTLCMWLTWMNHQSSL
jgi:asparagine synthase (glutamine-hydrolysing)